MRKNLLVLSLIIALPTIGQSVDIYLPSMPSMALALNTSVSLIQQTITLAMIAFGMAALVYGPLSDYFGRRKIALFGVGLFVGGSVVCIFAPNLAFLILGRIIQSLGIACAAAVAPAGLHDIFSGSQLTKAFSYVGMALAITPVIAPVLGGYLQHHFNWRAPFAFLFFYSLSIFLLFLFLFPETKKQLKQKNIRPSMMIKGYMIMLTDVKYLAFTFCFMLVFAGEISYAIVAPFLYQTKLGLSSVANGWLILVAVSGYLLGSFLSSRICYRFNSLQLIIIGVCCVTLGSAVMLFLALVHVLSVFAILLPMIVFMIGAGLIYPNAIAGGISCYPEQGGKAGSLIGVFQIGGGGIIASITAHLHVNDQLPLALILLSLSILAAIMIWILSLQPSN